MAISLFESTMIELQEHAIEGELQIDIVAYTRWRACASLLLLGDVGVTIS